MTMSHSSNGAMQMIPGTAGGGKAPSQRAAGVHAKSFQKLTISADSRRRELVERLVDTMRPNALTQMPDGSERPMNSSERKTKIKEGACAR